MARKPAFIRHSPEREAVIQSRMLTVMERSFARKAALEIRKESERMLRVYELTGEVPLPTGEDRERFEKLYFDMGLRAATMFGSRILSAGVAKASPYTTDGGNTWRFAMGVGIPFEVKGFADMFRALALSWINLEVIRQRITDVMETTRRGIVKEVTRGQKEGLGVQAIAKLVSDRVPEISRTRGALIARTELHGAANYSMHETAKSTGLELEKTWISTEDARTRAIIRDDAFGHLSMHGQKRDMDEPFDMPWIGGDDIKIMFPGEAGLPGGATIGCRCAVTHRVKGLDD